MHSPPIGLKELGLVGGFHVLICLPLHAILLDKTVTSSAESNLACVVSQLKFTSWQIYKFIWSEPVGISK